MRIAVMGAGGVGGYFGARLAARERCRQLDNEGLYWIEEPTRPTRTRRESCPSRVAPRRREPRSTKVSPGRRFPAGRGRGRRRHHRPDGPAWRLFAVPAPPKACSP